MYIIIHVSCIYECNACIQLRSCAASLNVLLSVSYTNVADDVWVLKDNTVKNASSDVSELFLVGVIANNCDLA